MELDDRTAIETKHEPHGRPEHAPSVPLTTKLDRYLKSTPVIAYGVTGTASWISTGAGFQGGLYNGGPSSLVWGFLVAGPMTAMIVLSFARMSSVDPEIGAQYRWAAIYCPTFLPRRFVSFLQGWLTLFAYISSSTLVPFFVSSQILGLVTLNYPEYEYKGWHATLLGYAIIAVPLLFNILARRTLKAIEIIGAVLTVLFFVVFVVVLVALGGRNDPEYVFFANSSGVSGWTNPTIQWCIGLVSVVFPISGFDAVVHLSDEVKSPETRIPRTMLISWIINLVTAFSFMIILLFFMGDPQKALDSPTNWPIIEICYQAAQELSAASAMMSMIIILGIVSYFNGMVAVSRLAWAFARDDGLPFADYFKVVHLHLRMPLRALGLTTLITMLLLLIPIGSTTAFNAILSLNTASIYISYTLPCLFIFCKRLSGEEIVTGPWPLGKWGVWVNGAAAFWGIFISMWLCFPSELPVNAQNMNWAGPIVGIVIIFSLIDWAFRGRFKFGVPQRQKDDIRYT